MGFTTSWYGFWDEWNLFHKITFDGANKLILVNYGVTDINIQIDVYSDWKEWSLISNNLRFEAAMRTVGGDPTVGSSFLGRTFFLINGWRMRTWEGSHTLEVDGNIFVDGGGSIFVNTLRPWTVQTNVLRSNLVDIEVVSGSSQVVSGGFSEADRIILERIDAITSNLPNSGTLADMQSDITFISSSVQTGFAASEMASGGVTSGGLDQIETDVLYDDNLFDFMHVAVSNPAGARVVRKIDTYLSSSGTFIFESAMPFVATSGSAVTVLGGYDPSSGQTG